MSNQRPKTLKPNLSTSKKKPEASNSKQIEFELRAKVQELEAEVKTLKLKLDELRKAKNTTLIKREKEFIATGTPQRQSSADTPSNPTASEEDVERLKLQHQKHVNQLSSEIESLKLASRSAHEEPTDCGHEEVIMALQLRLSDVESANTALSIQNEQLQEKLTQSYSEISQREAKHCEAQESMKVELQKKWQEMYNEWMKTTEAKIMELKAANDMLRRMLGATQ